MTYPDLPLHDQGATDQGRCGLGSVNGDSCRLGTDAESEHETDRPRAMRELRLRDRVRTIATHRAANRCPHELTHPDQMQVSADNVAVKKIVPRRPSQLLSGAVNQQPDKCKRSDDRSLCAREMPA